MLSAEVKVAGSAGVESDLDSGASEQATPPKIIAVIRKLAGSILQLRRVITSPRLYIVIGNPKAILYPKSCPVSDKGHLIKQLRLAA